MILLIRNGDKRKELPPRGHDIAPSVRTTSIGAAAVPKSSTVVAKRKSD